MIAYARKRHRRMVLIQFFVWIVFRSCGSRDYIFWVIIILLYALHNFPTRAMGGFSTCHAGSHCLLGLIRLSVAVLQGGASLFLSLSREHEFYTVKVYSCSALLFMTFKFSSTSSCTSPSHALPSRRPVSIPASGTNRSLSLYRHHLVCARITTVAHFYATKS
jgi:hypothetical protein